MTRASRRYRDRSSSSSQTRIFRQRTTAKYVTNVINSSVKSLFRSWLTSTFNSRKKVCVNVLKWTHSTRLEFYSVSLVTLTCTQFHANIHRHLGSCHRPKPKHQPSHQNPSNENLKSTFYSEEIFKQSRFSFLSRDHCQGNLGLRTRIMTRPNFLRSTSAFNSRCMGSMFSTSPPYNSIIFGTLTINKIQRS